MSLPPPPYQWLMMVLPPTPYHRFAQWLSDCSQWLSHCKLLSFHFSLSCLFWELHFHYSPWQRPNLRLILILPLKLQSSLLNKSYGGVRMERDCFSWIRRRSRDLFQREWGKWNIQFMHFCSTVLHLDHSWIRRMDHGQWTSILAGSWQLKTVERVGRTKDVATTTSQFSAQPCAMYPLMWVVVPSHPSETPDNICCKDPILFQASCESVVYFPFLVQNLGDKAVGSASFNCFGSGALNRLKVVVVLSHFVEKSEYGTYKKEIGISTFHTS